MVITEEELRQAWQNGRGQIPAFPPGTRFTPAALDFLKAREPAVIAAAAPAPARAAAAGDRKVLQAPPGQRLVFTTADLADLLGGGVTVLAVHPSVTITHAALERLRSAGIRVVPWTADAPPAPAAAAPAAPEPDLDQIKRAVLARLGGSVDPALLDAVLRRVLASL